jgi:putative peptidoglycan lipid II flippase
MRDTLSAAVRLVLLLTVPAAVFLAVMSEPLISLLFEHGRFTALATSQTAGALVMYCVGLPFFASIGIFTRTFYALGDTRTPMQASLVSVGLNVVLNLLMVGPLRGLGLAHRGLALAASAAAAANLTQLALYLRGRIGGFDAGRIGATLVRVLAASAAVGVVLWLGLHAAAGWWHRGHLRVLLTVLVSLVAGAALGWGALKLARVEELALLEDAGASVLRRFRR